ncbi:MAG TPA: spermidine/putrescine ABC transporter substrate-binding protein [Gemmatimonadales bacterium]|nr:spermidine/putrescine ABC transporter substrate-binding protein [Gemmatimonadales bacterium]
MRKSHEIEGLVQNLERGAISRREFVTRATVLGLGLSTIGALLTACKPGADKGAQGETAEPGPIEKELSIYNWSDYIAKETIPDFEKEFGVKVTYEQYESNEELLARLESGQASYDIVVPSGYLVPVLLAKGLIAPINQGHLTNWTNVAPIFLDPPYDPDNAHTVPWQWGTTGIAYRTDKIAPPPDSWAAFLDSKLKGRMTQMDDEREVIGAWLHYRGHSLNSIDPGELSAAKADALAAKANLKAYVSAAVKEQLISGEVWLAQLWNGDTAQARTKQPSLDYRLPKEGGTIWTDNLALTSSAQHKRAAHEFMNYILRPEVGAAISNFTGYGTPNQASLEKMTNPVPFPTADEMKRLEYQKDLGAAGAAWDKIWSEIKNA